MTSRSYQKSQSDSIAFNAVLSISESKPPTANEFLEYLDQNKLSPVGRIKGYPVYRLEDYALGESCYLVDERTMPGDQAPASVDFDLTRDFLVIKCTYSELSEQSFIVSVGIVNTITEKLNRAQFTPSELRVAAQVVCGMTLQSAAEHDSVAIETKRSHIKSVMGKIGVARQADLIRVLLSELLLITDARNWDKARQYRFNEYCNSYLPDQVRCHSLIDTNGKSVRVVDLGPQRGKPVIVLHSMIFPDITSEDVDFACRHNIRLIWPLRPGLLQSTPDRKSVDLYSKEVIEGIDLVWNHFCGEPVMILAMVSSAWHATHFTQKYPEKVADITFAATCFSAGKYENNIIYFGSSVAELCSRNTWLMTRTVDYIKKHVGEIEKFKSIVMKIFGGSEPDIETLNMEFSAPHHGRRLQSVMVDSAESIKHDYFNQVHFSWDNVKKVEVPVKFVHGDQDSLHRVCDLKRLIAGIGQIPLVQLKNTGHILQYENFRYLLRTALNLETE